MSIGSVQRSALLLVAAVCTLAVGRRAEAQPPSGPQATPPSAHDSALAEFHQARRLIDAGNCTQALPHLDEALAYEPSVGARISVAECIEKTDPLRAWRSLAEAALLAYANHDERMPIVEKRLDELERSVPMVQLQLTRTDLERPGLEVLIDGRSIDRYHVRRNLAVEPGPHTIEVRAFGKQAWTQSVLAPSPGHVIKLPVRLADRTSTAPLPEVAPPQVVTVVRMDPRATRRTVGIALGATGIAAIAAGAVFGVLAIGKRDELDDICGGNRESCTAKPEVIAPIRDNGSTLAAVSTVSFVVGGAALVSGIALYLWPSSSAPATTATARTAAGVRVSPAVGAAGTMQGMSIQGVF